MYIYIYRWACVQMYAYAARVASSQESRDPSAPMPWPRWEVWARHVDQKFRQSDVFSLDLSEKKLHSFANSRKVFNNCTKDADQRTPHYDTLNNTAIVSYDADLKGRVVDMDRDTDRSWMSTRARVEEAKGKKCSDGARFADLSKLSKTPRG